MSETVKLIVEIPKDDFKKLVNPYQHNEMCCNRLKRMVMNGILLDDVKADISEKSFNHYFEYGEYIGEDCRKERIIYSDKVIEILDNIGKGDKGMSRAYKCDRCGKLFEPYKHQKTANFLNITRNPCISGDCLDLCPKCNAELQEWVANDKVQVDCNCTDEEVEKSFVEDGESVKDFLERVTNETRYNN